MTALEPGSNWNTMPSHTHERRMEIYTYFEIPEGQAVFHMCGWAWCSSCLLYTSFKLGNFLRVADATRNNAVNQRAAEGTEIGRAHV